MSSECESALDILDSLYGRIIYDKLPVGNDWIEDLDILDAIRINHFGKFKSINEYCGSALNGIVTIGVKKDSDDYNTAIKILQDNGLMIPNLFIENSLLQDYMRINIGNFEAIDSLMLVRVIGGTSMQAPLSEQQKTAIKSIIELYVKDSKLKNDVEESFVSEWDKRNNLALLRRWLEKIPNSFSITSVGKVLAHANAQRCDNKLPPLNE